MRNFSMEWKILNWQHNAITNLLVDGELITDPATISKWIMQFYRCLYIEDDFHRPFLDVMDFNIILVEKAEWLEGQIGEEEVFGVI